MHTHSHTYAHPRAHTHTHILTHSHAHTHPQCWVSDRPYDLKKIRKTLFEQLAAAVFEPE